jgi:glutamyl-tRNA synthetase/nondiscriminating glutamyl-tRNA synthetase
MAHGQGGTFIVRIEDTDVERSTRESEQAILDDLHWLGLEWSEGVGVGGERGPYRQTERLHMYRAHAIELLSSGKAYQCFCSAEQLEVDRQDALKSGRAPKYTGRCRAVSREHAQKRIENGEAAVIRFRVPDRGTVTFDDIVRGPLSFDIDIIGDFVLLRSNGMPAYNFAVVIDDALMNITHIVRGEDHISNTPRQVLLYQAFGWTPPIFAHVPYVLGPDHAPLSKRHGATSVKEFRDRGYLPEALTNYLALLGWSPGEGEELLTRDELASRFRLENVGHSAGVFDPEKLAWVNRHYLKAADHRRLVELSLPYLRQAGWISTATSADLEFLTQIVPAAAASVDRLEQVPKRLAFLFDYSAERALDAPQIRGEANGARAVIETLAAELASSGPLLEREAFRAAATRVREKTGAKGKALFHPIRLALTGEAEGLELDLAVPAIDRGAALEASSGVRTISSARERAAQFVSALNQPPNT